MVAKIKLPKRFKKNWVDALLSGKFQQGKYKLVIINKTCTVENTEFCCLGVAEYICGTPIKNMRGKGTPERLGENSNVPKVLKKDSMQLTKLIDMNDSGKSFKQIASYIKRYL